jgi:trk system potassium uptake protein TrkA
MNIIIMGCSRVGAQLAVSLDSGGHKVTILDVEPYAFRFLPATFGGVAMVGNGLEQEALKKAGIEEADVFVSATQGDNRNVMACQIAKHIYHVPKVVSRIYDPIREEMYRKLGLDSVSPTRVVADLLQDKIEG